MRTLSVNCVCVESLLLYADGPQDDKYSYANMDLANTYPIDNAIMMFNSSQLPVKTAIAKNFAVL